MGYRTPSHSTAFRLRIGSFVLAAIVVSVATPDRSSAQGLSGALIGTVKDEQGAALPGADVRLSSAALIGSPATDTTDERGRMRFPMLPPGLYTLEITLQGFTAFREEDIRVGAGATLERVIGLTIAEFAESVVVRGTGSRIEARGSGVESRLGPDYLERIPNRRASMFDLIKAAPGISPTSQVSASTTLISSFGSAANENTFLMDGTNVTAPSNGVARSEPGIDFIQEIQIHSVGASAEYGNAQGAVLNIVTRQGSNRFAYVASYYAQASALTSQPVLLRCDGCSQPESGYERDKYRDFTTTFGGPIVRDRLWFFSGYQHLRDSDSQPGTNPSFPRAYEQDKIFGKLTWQLARGWQLMQSLHHEFWVNPEIPTRTRPFEATQLTTASVPAITFGHLTHAWANATVWGVRVGRFLFSQDAVRSHASDAPSRFDSASGVTTGAPQQLGSVKHIRSTVKASVSRYTPATLGAAHEWKAGAQFDSGEHRALLVIPTGVRFVDSNGTPSQRIAATPSNPGGRFVTAAAFVSDAIIIGDRVTINAGLRFDHSRAISQDVPALDAAGHETGATILGLGTMYTWNVWSPRLGLTAKLTGDGRTMLRASYGRFSQGVLTGEVSPVHPGQSPSTTAEFDPATADYTRNVTLSDPRVDVRLDPDTRAPRTDAYSLGVDRELGPGLMLSLAYVHKSGRDFIGWTDVGGQYADDMRTLPDGRTLPVRVLQNRRTDRQFLLTNPGGYSLAYNGVVIVAEKRQSKGWQASGAYTFSRASGLQAYSATTAAGPQISTVGAPPVAFAPPVTFGRDPNDLTNATGRLPNDRPHMFRVMGNVEVPRTGIVLGANLQAFSGKPWAATAIVPLPQNPLQRVLLEPRGSRRLSSQALLDVRVSKMLTMVRFGRIDLRLDLLNMLDDTAEEGLATDNVFSPQNFAQPNLFVDPRRVMISVRFDLGR